jgi:hypothetical protein
VSQAPDPKRWTAGDADVPVELARLIRAGQSQLGTPDEVTELAGRLAAALGPASGLAERAAPGSAGLRPPGSAGTPLAAPGDWPASAGARSLARLGTWLVVGASAAASVWLVTSWPSAGPTLRPPAVVRDDTPFEPESSLPPPLMPPPLLMPPPVGAPDASDAAAPASALASELTPAAASRPQPGVGGPRGRSRSRPTPQVAGEAALLERAQAALRADPSGALALTEQHQRRYPKGALGQEREVIAIEALKRLGRAEAASARAAAFERYYRGSVHRPRLERSTSAASPPGGRLKTAP